MSLRRCTQREHCKLVLDGEGEASICSYGYTFCTGCVAEMDQFVPTVAVSW